MKCSHGLPYEVKCSGCFKDAMKRISASQGQVSEVPKASEEQKSRFWQGVYHQVVDTGPRRA